MSLRPISAKSRATTPPPVFQYRDIQTVITKPTGEVTQETFKFLNPETEKARQAIDRVVPQFDAPATIIDLDPRSRTEPEQERQQPRSRPALFESLLRSVMQKTR